MRTTKKPARVFRLQDLTREMFHSYESGKIIAGIKHVVKTTEFGNESHECYQFDSFEELIRSAGEMMAIPGFKRVEIVTHKGQYEGMKTRFVWEAPVEDTSVLAPVEV